MKYDFNKVITRECSEKWKNLSVIDGHPVLPMSVADMDLASPVEITKALAAICARGEFGYPAYHADYKQVIAEWYQKYYAWKPSTDDIFETAPLLMTLATIIRGNTQPLDKVILLTPVYHAFASTVKGVHREITECNLTKNESNYYQIDFDALETACSMQENNVLIFCNPHNPVGRCWTAEEIAKVIEITQRNHVILISDEIHADFVFDNKSYTPVLKVAKDPSNIIVLSSGGKLFNIGGILSAYAFAVDKKMKKILRTALNELHFSSTIFAHEAAYTGYKYCHEYRQAVITHIRKMQTKMVNGLNQLSFPVKAYLPEATYLLWADFNDTGWTQNQIQHFLVKKAGLGFNRGDQFGLAGSGFARINCAVPESRIDQALSQLAKAAQGHPF